MKKNSKTIAVVLGMALGAALPLAAQAQTTADTTTSGVTVRVKESNGGVTFAGGLQFFMTQSLALRGEGQRYMKVGGGKLGDSDYSVYTVGLLWKFR